MKFDFKLDENKFYIAPSILSADFSNIKNILNGLSSIGIKIVHFDVMDNHFVPNLTFGHKFISDLRVHSNLFFDAHLMIDKPENWIDNYIKSGCDNITFHIESTKCPMEIIKELKKNNKSVGISIKPNTNIEEILEYLNLIDIILIMTVEPGFGGQKLIGDTVNKISKLKKIKDKKKLENLYIQADGGISIDNIELLYGYGLNIAVMGNAFFNNEDSEIFYKKMKSKIKNLDY